MKYDSFKHHRRSLRLKGYDYSSPGAYYVTICAKYRGEIFGDVVDGEMILNDAGGMVNDTWFQIINKFDRTILDEFIIMPNHFHGIIIIETAPVGANLRVRPDCDNGQTQMSAPTLPRIIQWFKSYTTSKYRKKVELGLWEPFPGRVWQRNFYDHIIRDEDEMNQIRQYIRTNPQNWAIDTENPDFHTK